MKRSRHPHCGNCGRVMRSNHVCPSKPAPKPERTEWKKPPRDVPGEQPQQLTALASEPGR